VCTTTPGRKSDFQDSGVILFKMSSFPPEVSNHTEKQERVDHPGKEQHIETVPEEAQM
jgi:hypothetical protein